MTKNRKIPATREEAAQNPATPNCVKGCEGFSYFERIARARDWLLISEKPFTSFTTLHWQALSGALRFTKLHKPFTHAKRALS
jgi:hypothetical protein